MSVVLFAHGGSGNHGCEALVRGTIEILRKSGYSGKIKVATCSMREDIKYGIKDVTFSEYNIFNVKNPIRYIDKIWRSVFKSGKFRKAVTKPIEEFIDAGDICLSIGGDNYSYPGVIPFDIIRVHNSAIKKGCKTVLWGCSINRENLYGKILKDLKNYDVIVARESITYNDLIKAGIDKEKVFLFPDSAFTLSTDVTNLSVDFGKRKYVGINLSPVVMSSETGNSKVITNYKKLIEYIIEKTDYNIVLVPHVVWQNSDDRTALKYLYNKYQSSNRVFFAEDQSACGLKGVISQCDMFIGARTHSTIAAYSSKVPTLVIGYSVKAKGIAKDLFGTYDNYVLSNDRINKEDDLINAFVWLSNNKTKIKEHLDNIMPGYVNLAYKSASVIFDGIVDDYE